MIIIDQYAVASPPPITNHYYLSNGVGGGGRCAESYKYVQKAGTGVVFDFSH